MKLELLSTLGQETWAIEPRYLQDFLDRVESRQTSTNIGKADLPTAMAMSKERAVSFRKIDSTAVIPIKGVILKERNWLLDYWEETYANINDLRTMLRQALGDKGVDRVVFDVESPGGTVSGVADLANEIYETRGSKPSIAFANGLMASAAYWLGSAASEIVTAQDAEVGSIGVYTLLASYNEYFKRNGIQVEMVKAGKYKGAGSPYKPIDDDTRKVTQDIIDHYYTMFVDAVGKHRSLSVANAKKLADGRVHVGSTAVDLKLADATGIMEGGSITRFAATTTASVTAQVSPAGGLLVEVPKSVKRPAQQGTVIHSHRRKESKMDNETEAMRLEILTAEQFAGLRPDLVKLYEERGVQKYKERCSAVAQLIDESDQPEETKAQLHRECREMSVEQATARIARVDAIEGALSAARMQGVDDDEIDDLRADVAKMGDNQAIRHIARAVKTVLGTKERLVKYQDKAATGQDTEQTETSDEPIVDAALSEAVKTARASWAKDADELNRVSDGTASEASFIRRFVKEAGLNPSDEQLQAAAPDVFKAESQ